MTLQPNSVLQPFAAAERTRSFDDEFAALFKSQYQRIYRILDRMSGDPDAAEDLAQETFVRLYRRQSLPDEPSAWLVTVGMNLLRNQSSSNRRHAELLVSKSRDFDEQYSSDEAAVADDTRTRVRRVVDKMSERERSLLLLRAEGYSYREIAVALELNAASVGTLLARAQRSFRSIYEETSDAR